MKNVLLLLKAKCLFVKIMNQIIIPTRVNLSMNLDL